MAFINTIIDFALVIVVLVVVHELGHFLVGLLLKASIKEFSVGFGPSIFYIDTKQGIRFNFRIILFGGYVRFDESHDNPDSFFRLKAWKRILIALAGPVFNILFAWIVFIGMYWGYGHYTETPFNKTAISRITPNSPAQKAGLHAGDIIEKINGKTYTKTMNFSTFLQVNKNKSIQINYVRRGKQAHIMLIPAKEIAKNVYNQSVTHYFIGIELPPPVRISTSFFKGIQLGTISVENSVVLIANGFRLLFTGQLGSDSFQGPVGIAVTSAKIVRKGLQVYLGFLAILSVNLAIINLIPLPVLDGGNILISLIEWIRRKPIKEKIKNRIFLFSLLLLLLLVIFFTINDIKQLWI